MNLKSHRHGPTRFDNGMDVIAILARFQSFAIGKGEKSVIINPCNICSLREQLELANPWEEQK